MSFASDQLARIEALLARNPGVRPISVDGVTVSYDDLIAQRKHWQKEIAKEDGGRSPIVPISLGGF